MDDESYPKVYEFAKKFILLQRLGEHFIPPNLTGEAYEEATRHVPWICLILDGHSTHLYNVEINKDAQYYKILIANYIPHTTHITQPLDSGINTAIKVKRKMMEPFTHVRP